MKHQKRLALAPRAMERCWSRVGVGEVFLCMQSCCFVVSYKMFEYLKFVGVWHVKRPCCISKYSSSHMFPLH